MNDTIDIIRKDEIYPLTIISDRYSGTYSGGVFLAFNLDNDCLPYEVGGSDSDEMCFYYPEGRHNEYVIGKGSTPHEAYMDLYNKLKE